MKNGAFLSTFVKFQQILYSMWYFYYSTIYSYSIIHQLIVYFINNILFFFENFNYIFHYYYQKVNKNIYKYSRYRVSRFNLKFFYIPKYRRYRLFITFVLKSINYEIGRVYLSRQLLFFINFFFVRSEQYFYKFIYTLQRHIFINYRKTLFLLSRYKI